MGQRTTKRIINDRERATILAALRHFQAETEAGKIAPESFDHFNCDDLQPLNSAGIDKLCDQINRGYLST